MKNPHHTKLSLIRTCCFFALYFFTVILLFKSFALEASQEKKSSRLTTEELLRANQYKKIHLTEKEQRWIETHPVIRVANEVDWPPYDFASNGKAQGYSIDLIRLIADSAGLEIEFVNGYSWSHLVQLTIAGEIDVLPAIWRTKERAEIFNFTSAYHKDSNVLIARKGSSLGTIDDLDGHVLSVIRDFAASTIIKRKYPDVRLLEVNDVNTAMLAVSIGKADAYIGSLGAVSYIIKNGSIPGLRVKGIVTLDDEAEIGQLFMATLKQEVILGSILQKGLDALDESEKQQLKTRWILDINPVVTQMTDEPVLGLWLLGSAVFFTLLFGSLYIATQRIPDTALVRYFGSGGFYLPVLVSTILIMVLVGIAINYTLQKNRREILAQVQNNLTIVHQNATQQIESWVNERFNFLLQLGQNSELVSVTDNLLKLSTESNVLKTSHALSNARRFFMAEVERFGNEGFFIINAEMINIGSARDSNIGQRNLIAKQRPDLLKRAFSGEAVFIPPVISDIRAADLQTQNSCGLQCMSMFFAVPIRNQKNDVIAVLTQRLSPKGNMSSILRGARIGDSGESYAINSKGLLASESRFREHLFRAGLLNFEQHEVGTIEIRDPGGNLLQGYQPKKNGNRSLTTMANALIQLGEKGIGRNRSKLHTNFKGYSDYRGVPVFGVGMWNYQLGLGIISEIDADEALVGFTRLQISLLTIAAILLLIFVSTIVFTLLLSGRAAHAMLRSRNELEKLVDKRTHELKRSQENLLTSNKRITLAASAIKLGIWDWDLAEDVTTWDARMFEIYGMQEKHPLGHNLWEKSIFPEDKIQMRASFKKCLKRGKDNVEFRVVQPDGTIKHIYSAGAVIYDENNMPARMIGVNWDITQRKVAEHALKVAKKEAESASQTKSSFLANMSHEIRTPMNAITGLGYLMLQTSLNEQQRDYIEKIQVSSHSLLGVINDVLDFSKIEAGRLKIENTPFQLDEVIENLTSLLALETKEKNLEILFSIAPDVPRHLVGDSQRLGQVLVNLLQNAIKFTEQGGVVIRVCQTGMTATSDEVKLEFSIMDTGIGIDKLHIAHLFDAFSQVDESNTRRFEGTGLGLAICQQLIELMGGKINVESTVGKGSVFTFQLTFGIEQPLVKPVVSACFKGKSVLIVDGNIVVRQTLTSILESLLFEVRSVESGQAAYDIIKQIADKRDRQFDLVMLDGEMPEASSIETALKISKEINQAHISTIVMASLFNREEIMQHSKRAGLDAFLVKPINSSALLRTIVQVMQGIVPASKHIKHALPVKRLSGEVLLVEDNKINQQVAQEILENMGLFVYVANDGIKALKALEEHDFDLVLTDLQMPKMDGYELTHQIRQHKKYHLLPVIAMTAHAMVGDKERCLDLGMNDHIAKPIDPDLLLNALSNWLSMPQRPVLTSEPSEDTFIALPAKITGIDISQGLNQVGGNKQLFSKLLREFFQDYANTEEKIGIALKTGDIELAHRLVHTILGIAGSIGARDLLQTAEVMDSLLKDKNTPGSDMQSMFIAALSEVLEGIKTWLKEKDSSF